MRLAPLHGFLRPLSWGKDPDARRRGYVIHHQGLSCPLPVVVLYQRTSFITLLEINLKFNV